MRITIKDVARVAKVSQATVSLVLNEAPGVSKTTREHVMSVMRDMNYKPDALARSFSSRRASALALVMPPFREAFDDPYFTHLLLGVLEAVRDHNYHLVLEVADERFGVQRLWNELYSTRRVDAFVVATPYLDQDYLVELAAEHIPALLLNGARTDLPGLDFIGYDDVRCGVDATYYLIGLGHRRIAHLGGPSNQASARARLQGYRDALERSRIPYREEYVFPGDYKTEMAEAAMEQILAMPVADRPTAVFCANDTAAIAAMEAALAAGVRVPQELSFVGVDDTGAADRSIPSLTTFRQDIFVLAKTGADRFITRLDQRGEPGRPFSERIEMEFVERESCAPVER